MHRGTTYSLHIIDIFRVAEQNKSKIVAPTNEVILFTSNGGDTSTTSPPTKLILFSALIIVCASLTLKPPTSGVPVPGAKVGSIPSISNVK